MNTLEDMANSDDSCNTLGMWRQVRKLFPKVLVSAPSGLKDHKGKIRTKSIYGETYDYKKISAKIKKKTCQPPNKRANED